MKNVFLFITMFVTVLGCRPEPEVEAPEIPSATVYHEFFNVSYGADARQKLDVMLPAGRDTATKLAIFIHGGSWNAGDKADMHIVMRRMIDSGIACVSINYRYASASLDYEDLMNDVALAVQYCKEQAGTWSVSEKDFVIGGASAGAHLAMLHAYKYDDSDQIGAVVALCGPSDFTDIDWLNYASFVGLIGVIENIVGAKYVVGSPLTLDFAQASPKHFVAGAPPTLLIHGSTDLVVPFGQSYELHLALNVADVENKLVEYPATGHDLGIGDPSRFDEIVNHMVDWCRKY